MLTSPPLWLLCSNERYADHQYWMSSTGWATSMAQGGIFNPDGPSAWGDANRIYLKYWCAASAVPAAIHARAPCADVLRRRAASQLLRLLER
jgi:hypothetical protein